MGVLKPTDLMIRDWVIYDPNVFIEDEYEPSHGLEYYKISSGEFIDNAENDCYYGIPIHTALLEKLGYVNRAPCVYTKEYKWANDLNGENTMTVYITDESLFGHGYKVKVGLVTVYVKYLHELQHLIRCINLYDDTEIKEKYV